jgi:hypothetical protein
MRKYWLTIVLSIILAIIVYNIVESYEYAKIEAKVKAVKIGMSRSEVKKIAGEPQHIKCFNDNAVLTEHWGYKHSSLKSTPPMVVFDANNDRVIKVLCGEDYRIIDDKLK